MNTEQLIRQYIPAKHMMQVATLDGDQPWICTVYYVVDESLNLYWASLPTRRHSKEVAGNAKVAVAIPISHTIGDKVVGIQAEGRARQVIDPDETKRIATSYAKKFNRSDRWATDFSTSKTQHKLYKFVPELFVLFDEVNFDSANSRQEWKPGSVK